MPTLWAASARHLLRHPAQLILALVGLSVGVATIVAVDIATASAARAFQLSMNAVNGTATHQIVGGPRGIDERLYVDLRLHASEGPPGTIPSETVLSPVVDGYVNVGDRALQLVGIDPFAAAGLAADNRVAPPAGVDWTRWLTERGAVVMAADTARALGLAVNARFDVEVGGKPRPAVLIGVVPSTQPGYDSLLLTDIAQAQEWLEQPGRLSRIDVRVPDGGAAPAAARIQARLPPALRLEPAQSRARQSLDMTAAFTVNLQAMSLLALLVGTLLIYGAVSFAVVQRRQVMGALRALGATRANLLSMILSEAAVLGIVGSVLGLLAGRMIGKGLVQLVSQTINDLYFVVAVNETVLPATAIAKALLAGFGAAIVGALLPAIEVAGSMPHLGLRRSVLEGRAALLARRLLAVSAVLAVASVLLAALSTRSLLAGFVALFLLLLSVAALTPAALRAVASAAARATANLSPVARLAFSDIAASLSRTGVAVAALGMAVAAMIGVSIMVESFRESLREWLTSTMRADIYVTAPGSGAGRPERRIEPEVLRGLLATPGIVDYGMSRRVMVELPGGPVPLDAVRFAQGHTNTTLTVGDAAQAWPAFAQGQILVSEPLAWRLRLNVGDRLNLTTDAGARAFPIAGIYREYGNDRGTILMRLDRYRALWHDEGITALGFYLAPGVSLDGVESAFRGVSAGKQSLYIRSNAQLRALSMSIFERTFVITRVLYWLAAGVAAIGLISALLAWELERSRELGILRSLGLTPRGAALLIESQTGFMGLVALLAAVPAGLLTAWLLIDVINRRAFGWRIDIHLSVAQFSNALLLSITAALAAGLYPAWRTARASIADDIREE